ncbi:MAG: Ig-like domain-containing protein [Micromonosporaceae bacterium]
MRVDPGTSGAASLALRVGNGRFSVQGSHRTARRTRYVAGIATAVTAIAALLLLSACSGSGGGLLGGHKPKPTPAAQVTITPTNGSKNARTDGGITVKAADGKLTSVTVHTKGTQVTGSYSQGGTVWHSKWTLGTSQNFRVTATAVNSAGKTVTATSSFHTFTPHRSFQTQIFEGSGQSYGVGMPVMLTFSAPIRDRANVERALELRTSKPVVGAWWWANDQTLNFRPKSFWPTHTKVTFIGHLDGLRAGPSLYGSSDLAQSFNIGDSIVVHVSTSGHYMKVFKNGKRIYTWPISSGKPGDDTPNGTFLTIDKGNPVEMKPADISPGQPGYYDVKVNWSVRFTWSGDYIHSAPWSVGEQGSVNVSHGCVNLGPQYAPIYYNMELQGSPVKVSGSPADGVFGDGWTDWFMSWEKMLKKSATGMAVQAGPDGSTFVSPDSLNTPSATPSSTALSSTAPAATPSTSATR